VKQSLLIERYPVYTLEIDRSETELQSIDAVCAHLRERIEAHRCARFIADFDHLAHTRSLPEGLVGEDILAARNLVFSFGITLPDPQALALRPRSIGVAETSRGFLVTFLEAPMPIANTAMEDWAMSLRRPAGPPGLTGATACHQGPTQS